MTNLKFLPLYLMATNLEPTVEHPGLQTGWWPANTGKFPALLVQRHKTKAGNLFVLQGGRPR